MAGSSARVGGDSLDELFVEASDTLKSAVEKHADYIKAETLTTTLNFAAPPANASVVEDEFEGEKVKVGLVKSG